MIKTISTNKSNDVTVNNKILLFDNLRKKYYIKASKSTSNETLIDIHGKGEVYLYYFDDIETKRILEFLN